MLAIIYREKTATFAIVYHGATSVQHFHVLPWSRINSIFATFYHRGTSIQCLPYSTKQTIHDHILQSVHWMHDAGINKSRYWYVFSSLILYSFPQ